MSLTYSRTFAAAGVIAVLAMATQAHAGQADRRATNATQKAGQRNEPDSRPTRGEEARPPAPAARPSPPPQATAASRNSRPPQTQAPAPAPAPQSRGTVQGYAVRRPATPSGPAHPPPDHDVRHPPVRPVVVRPVVVAPRYVVIAPRRPAWGYFHRGWHAPRHIVRYHQPYYVFQPRVRFSFGLTIGHSVAYPVWYDPYPVYGYSLGPRYGGISFDIDPSDAAIFIDGDYVGIVDDFSPYDAPLTLRAGLHRVEIRARGMQPMDFDITVVPGQVIPYRGTLAYGY